MEVEGSSPLSQEPATAPYPEPDKASQRPPSYFLNIILILSSHLRLGLPSGVLPSGSATKTL